ncbi:NYN domain-containing protein [Phytoactinopolyspora halotolerans]|uniref:NYN domain-containing protein n=1 Tax=Phytoactinopolyspora halotolerans TaxID=1981512 RepID=A0A6L9SE24_9ACTN|nr:NYN domain-containing protein [Phytoactinopolyspora halotolerans]NEE03279.1 NYN domain-containing protein [Phytoactinopolyspora halotolerans]
MAAAVTQTLQRVLAVDIVAYVDALNLYHGLTSRYGDAYSWRDVVELVRRMRQHDTVVKVKYFTAIVAGEPDAAARQESYLAALTAYRPEVEVIRGHFKKKTARCRHCRARYSCACDPPQQYKTHEEKLTDVALGVAMTADAATRSGDMSLLISADTDFQPAVEMSLRLDPARPVIVACPPGRIGPRHNLNGRVVAFPIPERHLRDSLLPDVVTASDGRTYARPTKWRQAADAPRVNEPPESELLLMPASCEGEPAAAARST